MVKQAVLTPDVMNRSAVGLMATARTEIAEARVAVRNESFLVACDHFAAACELLARAESVWRQQIVMTHDAADRLAEDHVIRARAELDGAESAVRAGRSQDACVRFMDACEHLVSVCEHFAEVDALRKRKAQPSFGAKIFLN